MADETEQPASDSAPKKGGKKALVFGGGGVAVLALAYMAALMALPSKNGEQPRLKGPFVAPLTETKVQVNLAGSKSFLVVNFNLIYEAFEQGYYIKRSLDPVYTAELTDVLVEIASAKTREEVSDRVNKPVILEEIRQAVDPLLFPVHIGEGKDPAERDKLSGLAPGLSSRLATFRPVFGEHVLTVDAIARKLRLGEGPEVTWTDGQTDVRVENALGQTLFVDTSRVEPDFQGDVPIGVRGHIRRLLWNEVLIQ
ncbi:MAG TPA: hypothetical protein VMT18_05335 [Planctomycetota bacterium]|nr:hypothetical protein [Planctomycetota bacterium]